MPMDQQTVVVIGGSSGIGHEVALQTSAQGARLIITGRNAAKIDAVRLSGAVKTAVLDAHDETALESVFSRLKPINHLVSMVGDSMTGGFLTTPPETMRHVLYSKFWTNWMIGRRAAPTLREGGSITFTSGTGARAQDTGKLRCEPGHRGHGSRARLRAGPPRPSHRGGADLHGDRDGVLERNAGRRARKIPDHLQ